MDYNSKKNIMFTTSFKNFLALSLIELMISLITISCIVAAFTPVITKKMKNSNVTISGNNVSDITTDCSDKFSSNCKLCTKSYCIQCELNSCPIGQYAENKSCSCKDCSTLHSNCLECDSTKCTKCKDNNYYINNGKCETCPTGKICDGINAYDESYCANPPTGYFCEGNTIKRCSDKYSANCASCNSVQCLSCISGFYLDSNKDCSACSYRCAQCKSENHCIKCLDTNVLDETTHSCNTFCNSQISYCVTCSSKNICTSCAGGYYVNLSNTCSPCTDIANCINCSSGSKCDVCKQGYYVNNSSKCALCTIANCAQCDKDGTCLSCNQNYHQSEDKKSCLSNERRFSCSDPNFMRIGNLCVTRKNMGDSYSLPIPATVTIVETGGFCEARKQNCCWKGATSKVCNSNNGGYSGCNRTVCNWNAAKEICAKFNYAGKTWRLPTVNEISNWGENSIARGANGLMLCVDQSGYSTSAQCANQESCFGSFNDYCGANIIWSSNFVGDVIYTARIYYNNFLNSSYYSSGALSVRCVTEME